MNQQQTTRPAVQIVEVSARDGIQNEDVLLSTDTKVQLIESAVAAGLRRIEAVSFAHPTRVPQMADAEAVSSRCSILDPSSPASLRQPRRVSCQEQDGIASLS